MATRRRRHIEEVRARVLAGGRPHVFIELRPSPDGCYAKARIEGAPDRLARTFVGVPRSRDEAISEATSWALGWLRVLREAVAIAGGP